MRRITPAILNLLARLAERVSLLRRAVLRELRSKTFRRFRVCILASIFVMTGTLSNPKPTMAAPCATGNDVTISVGCEWAAGTHVYTGTLTIDAAVIVTAQADTGAGTGVTVIVDDLVLNGTITADTQGYAAGIVTSGFRNGGGPGGGLTGGFASGGAHGGRGGGNNTNLPYGSAFAPTTLGSGGANDGETGSAGAGGGAVKIFVADGGSVSFGSGSIITANGGSATTADHGGGAGGSIWIDATNGTVSGPASGTATIRANGGNAVSNQGGGSGGGGRVAVMYSTLANASNIAFSASAGAPGNQSGFFTPGGAGSIFLKDAAAANGDLIFDNGNRVNANFTDQTASSTYLIDNLTIRNGARYHVPATYATELASGGVLTGGGTQQPRLTINGAFDSGSTTFLIDDVDIDHNADFAGTHDLVLRNLAYDIQTVTATFSAGDGGRIHDLTIDTGATFTVEQADTLWVDRLVAKSGSVLRHANNTTAETHKLIVSATNSIELQTGSSVSLDGFGYSVGNGPGAGSSGSNTGGGGGHGGDGGRGAEVSALGGGAYGSVSDPSTIGSGGATDEGNTQGTGGGAVRLMTTSSTGTIDVSGVITVDGVSTTTSDAGAGAGGSVYISTSVLTGNGSVTATGGNADNANGGGGGGGGRIALYYDTDASSITLNARGGDEGNQSGFVGRDGGAGTIYRKDNQETYATLIVDNGTANTSVDTPQLNASETYKDITIAGNATYAIGNGETLTLDTGGTLTGGGTTQATLRVDAGGTFTPPTANFTFDDIDVVNNGDIATVTALTIEDGSFTHGVTGDFPASGGVTSLSFGGGGPTFTQDGGANLNLTSLTVPTGATFNITSEKYHPFHESFGALTVAGTFNLSRYATLFVDAFTVQTGGIATHATNTASYLYRFDVSATSSIEIASGGRVFAKARGYTGGGNNTAGNGPGGGATGGFADGGGHGGRGGHGGNVYDSATAPYELGSGGGGDDSSGTGGNGGGYVRLAANSGATVTIDGIIDADGGSTVTGAQDAGGGAGGSIFIDAAGAALDGAGTMTADGGSGLSGEGGGGGGGGRIAVYAASNALSAPAPYSVGGGASGSQSTSTTKAGGAGSIFLKLDAQDYGDLVIDNDNRADAHFTDQTQGNQTYDSITIREGSKYRVTGTQTLALDAGGTLTGGGSLQPSLQTLSGAAFAAGGGSFTFDDIDVTNDGTISVVTGLTVLRGAFTHGATGNFSAGGGVTSLSLSAGAVFTHAGGANLNLASLAVPSDAEFALANENYYPFAENFGTLSVTGRFSQDRYARFFLDTLTIPSGGIVTHASNTASIQYRVDISATSSIDVQSGGFIDADRRGYAAQNGPGKGETAGNSTAGGGAYGGDGGSVGGGGDGGASYGFIERPEEAGSGGGDDTANAGQQGGAGGGVIRLIIGSGGTITVNGTVSANGDTGKAGGDGGGGAGGSVWIDAATNTIAGTGTVRANGAA